MTLTGTDGHTLYEFSPNDVIAKGGTSNVFKGRNISTGESIAVKVYYRELTSKPEILERIITESKIKLHSPHFIEVYDLIKTSYNGENIYHLITEFVEGTSVSEKIKEGPLSKESTQQIASVVSEFLDKLHEFQDPTIANHSKICHRDINPSNILISNSGEIKVIDLGIAKVNYTDNRPRLTKVNQVLGTTSYMPPEQFNEGAFGVIGTYSDFYSLAITLYECLTGNLPFSGKNDIELYHEILNRELPPHPNLSAALYSFFKKATNRNPLYRFQNGIEFIKAFNAALYPTPTNEKKPKLMVWGFAGIVILILIVYFGLNYRDINIPIEAVTHSESITCKLCFLGTPPSIFLEDSISNLNQAKTEWQKANSEKSKWISWFKNPDNFNYPINTNKLDLNDSMFKDPVQKLLIHVINTTTIHSKEKKSEMLNSLDFNDLNRIRNILKSEFQEKSNILNQLENNVILSINKYKKKFNRSFNYLISSRKFDLALEIAESLNDKLKSSQVKFLLDKSYSISSDILLRKDGEYGLLAIDVATKYNKINEVVNIGNSIINSNADSLSMEMLDRSLLIANIYYYDNESQVDSTLFHFSQLIKLTKKSHIDILLIPDAKSYIEWLNSDTLMQKYEPLSSLLNNSSKIYAN